MRERNPRSVTQAQAPAKDAGLDLFTTIAGVIAGTLAAVALVPTDPGPRGALFKSGAAMVAGLLVGPLRLLFQNPRMLVRADLLLVLSPIYWLLLDLVQKAYDLEGVQKSDVVWSFYCIGGFVVAACVGFMGRPWRMPRWVHDAANFDADAGAMFKLVLISFVVGMMKFAIPCRFNFVEMVSYLSENRWAAPWTRGEIGGWDAFLDHMAYFGFLLPTFAVVIAIKRGWTNMGAWISFAFAGFFGMFIAQSGGRRNVGVMFGAALMFWMVSQRRLKTKGIVVVVVAVSVLLFIMQAILGFRELGIAETKQRSAELERRGYVHVDDNFYRLSQTVQLIPAKYPHTHLHYFIYVLGRPIPRVLWPGKPITPGFALADALEEKGVSFSVSVIGEFYMAGGILVILLGGWFYGRLAEMGNALLERRTLGGYIIYCIWVMALFAGMRSMIDLILFSYVILAWVGLVWIMRWFTPESRIRHRNATAPTEPRAPNA